MADGAGPRFDIAGLDILYQRLASAGFKVGPAGQSRANLLLLEFISRDALPDDPEDLARWLQPIFVTRSEDRARFFDTVMAWSRSARHVEIAPEEEKQAPKQLLPKRDWDGGKATPPPERKPPLWRRVPRAAWVGLAALAVLGGLAAVPAVRGWAALVWAQMTAPPVETPTATTETSTATTTDTTTATTVARAPETVSTMRADEDIGLLLQSIKARADVYGGAPSLRELYSATPSIDGELATALPGDPETTAAQMGFPVDRPLPLMRLEVVQRLIAALRPDTGGIDAQLFPSPSRIADIVSGRDAAVLLPGANPDQVAWSADGRLVATAAAEAQVWDSYTGERRLSFQSDGALTGIALNPAGGQLAGAAPGGVIMLWPLTAGASPTILRQPSPAFTLEYDPTGQMLATASAEGTVRIWDVQSGRILRELRTTGEVWDVNYSSDGALIAAAGPQSGVSVWRASDGGLLWSAMPSDRGAYRVAFSPSGDRLIGSYDRDGALRLSIWDAETGREIASLRVPSGDNALDYRGQFVLLGGSAADGWLLHVDSLRLVPRLSERGQANDAAFSPDGVRVAVAEQGRDGVRIYRPLVLVAAPIADEMERRSLTKAQLGERVRAVLGLQPYPDIDADAEAQLSPADREALIEQRAESASDDDIARAWALLSFDTGWPLNISDPPWLREDQQRAADPLRPYKDNANWIVAGLVAFIAIALWLWSAINARGFLARRRPDDSGRVADLAAEDRSKAERADQSLRIAARRLLERRESTRALDLTASVDATARAGGFFTPVSRAHRRIPEYLFLIDSRSRFDHDAKRALDYVERLRAENVKADFYFFERAPDRVREDIGHPLVPLETITSQHATRRLVVVGDAAAMLESDGKTVGRWADTVKVWEDRALMTTVPVSEWGEEENRLAGALGMLVRPLSANALAQLPAEMRNETDVQRQVAGATGLGERPLPSMLREAPHIWTMESPPSPPDIDRMLAELHAFLGQHGFRWLSACAVYPAIEWDLTMALGWRLKEGEAGDERPLVNEQRTALISELPWMRTGAMPQWLRERLLDEMSPQDRQSVRAFLGELLDTARNSARAPRDTITLSFSVEGGRGRDMFDDDVFVQFLLEDPKGRDTRALEATKKVRELLLPPLAARLLRPAELAVLLSGLLLAAAAWWIAPRFTDAPLPTGAWAPLAALAFVPLVLWLVHRPLGALVGSAWRTLRDPRGAWDDWRERAEARKVVRDTDRLAYLQSIAPSRFRWVVAAEAAGLIFIAAGIAGSVLTFLLDPLSGVFSAARAAWGETVFGAAVAIVLFVALGLLAVLAVAAHALTRGLLAQRAPAVAEFAPERRALPGVLGLTLVGLAGALLGVAIALVNLANGEVWTALITLTPAFAAYVLFLFAGQACDRLQRRIRRLQLGLDEKASRVEVTAVVGNRVSLALVNTLRLEGLRVETRLGSQSGVIRVHGIGQTTLRTTDFLGSQGVRNESGLHRLLKEIVTVLRERPLSPQEHAKQSAPGYVFISYAKADKERVGPVIAALRSVGFWEHAHEPDESDADRANAIDRLQKSDACIVVASAGGLANTGVSSVVREAVARWRESGQNFFVAPVFLDADSAKQMQDELDSFQGYSTFVEPDGTGWKLTADGAVAARQLDDDVAAALMSASLDPSEDAAPAQSKRK